MTAARDTARARALARIREREAHIEHILATLSELAREADRRANKYWDAKDHLDAYLREVMEMPQQERPTGEQMAAVVGRDRRRLYQIRHRDPETDPGKHVPRRPG